MAGRSLNIASKLQCPHGGTVIISSTNARARASSQPMALQNDTYAIAGCPFTLPGPKPSPCVRVEWIVPDIRVKVNGSQTLSQGSTGLCLSAENALQGPVIVVNTQSKVKSL